MSEKSNVERLGEDLKDVAQDATNNEAVKAPGEKISEMGNGETAQTAQVKLAKAAQSEYAKAVLAKLDAVANSAVVQQAKGRFFEEFSNAKGWVSSNWNAGCYGKFRVVMAVIIVLLAFRGLLCGWGSGGNLGNARLQEKIEKSEVAAESFGGYWDEDNVPSSSSSSRPSGLEKKLWICRQCGNQVQSVYIPPQTQCRRFHGQNDGSCERNCRWMQVH